MGALAEPGDATTQADRITAETLIRSTVQVLASGSAIRDLDGLVQRNVGNVSHADIRAGRLGSNVLGDIISTVEQAKGGAPFNWNAASPQQISAYLASKGITLPGESTRPGQIEGGKASDSNASSARYDGMALGAKGDWSSAAGQAYMRDYAMQHGLPWAANNPDLLRLGPSAIKALADVHLSQQSYDRVTKDAAFRPQDVVTLAKFAKEKNVDANAAATAISDVGKGLTPEEKEALRKGLLPYMSKPNDQKAQQRANEALDEVGRKHPGRKPEIEKAKQQLKIETGKELQQQHTTQDQITTKQNDLAAFESAEPASTKEPQKPKTEAPPASANTKESKLDGKNGGATAKTAVAAASPPKAKAPAPSVA
jgi:hypothetical protein